MEIAGYPCNQYLKQDPGSTTPTTSIMFQDFYSVPFPVVEKSHFHGPANESPAWTWFRNVTPLVIAGKEDEDQPKAWNFHKFLLNDKGEVMFSYEPHDNPLSFTDDIESLLY